MFDAVEFAGFFDTGRRILATRLVLSPLASTGYRKSRGANERKLTNIISRRIYPTSCVALVLEHPCCRALLSAGPASLSPSTTSPQPPADTFAQRLDDSDLIRDIFAAEYCPNLRRFVPCDDPTKPVFKAQQHWMRVVSTATSKEEFVGKTLISCILVTTSSDSKRNKAESNDGDSRLLKFVDLTLHGEDAVIACLVQKGNYIGMLCPLVNPTIDHRIQLEYGPQTILFVLQTPVVKVSDRELNAVDESFVEVGGTFQEDDAVIADDDNDDLCLDNIDPTQFPEKTRADGFVHLDQYTEKPKLGQITGKLKHLCLFGRVLVVSENIPVTVDGQSYDRYALRLSDEDGNTRDITLWDDLGVQMSRVLPGQYVLIGNLVTEMIGKQLSTIPGIISSSGLRKLNSLHDIRSMNSGYAKVIVTDVIANSERATFTQSGVVVERRDLCNTKCQRPVVVDGLKAMSQLEGPVDSYPYECPSCQVRQIPGHDVKSVFDLSIEIDDGSDSLIVETSFDVAHDIVGTSTTHYLSTSSKAKQSRIIMSMLEKEYICGLTRI
ncbi:hypothetical protein EV182_002780, partial [Spiromyces aspiralis]